MVQGGAIAELHLRLKLAHDLLQANTMRTMTPRAAFLARDSGEGRRNATTTGVLSLIRHSQRHALLAEFNYHLQAY